MSIERGFRLKESSNVNTRRQVQQAEHRKALILQRISSQYVWAEGEISEIKTLIAEIEDRYTRVLKIRKILTKRMDEIEELMTDVELDEETLQKAAKYDEHLAKTRSRVRKWREKE